MRSGATQRVSKVGNFSEQVWGDSDEHHQPTHFDPGDRAARQRRMRVALQPDHRRQRRLAMPSVLQLQNGSRTTRAPFTTRCRHDPSPAGQLGAALAQRWPSGVPVLFPSPYANPDGLRSFAYATFSTRLARWCQQIGLHDETGQTVSVTAHQFRHTLGTRLINAGVPQHVVQKMLGHASPQMTARYATLHDSTVRAAFDEYQQRRVNIDGNQLDFDPDASTADAEWIKHNLARAQASLPNGYCGRPPQQDCPHPNACLTCPDFQTTPTFLPIHRRQHDDTLELIEIADQHGNQRLAANHRRVAANLQNVITALETIDKETPDVN